MSKVEFSSKPVRTAEQSAAKRIAVHRISWWVYAGDERIPRTATMRGTWGYDATCSCGWDSRTGGALRRYVADQVWTHKRASQSL